VLLQICKPVIARSLACEATWQSILTTPAIFANLNAGEAAKLPKNCFEQKSVKSRVEQAEA